MTGEPRGFPRVTAGFSSYDGGYEIHAGGCHFTNETFRQFVEQHPELEYIEVSWTPELTDISPLLTLKNLNRACVSNSMPQAIASLGDPTELPFELEIEN